MKNKRFFWVMSLGFLLITLNACGGGGSGSSSGGGGSTLVSIYVTPINQNVPEGTAKQFAASGTYSDGTSHDITTQVSWSSSNISVATIDSRGLASPFFPGTVTIAATLGSISGNTTLTVTASPSPSGYITICVGISGDTLAGVTINFSGDRTNVSLTTNEQGNLVYTPNVQSNSGCVLILGAVTVTPVKAGYTFTPSSLAVKEDGTVNFAASANTVPTYSISGTVSGAVLSGVTITLSGAGSATAISNASGNYSFSNLVNGSYTVKPSMAGYTFTPTSLAATVSGANITGTNFVATANTVPTYSISGTVSGAVLSGVTITLSGAGSATTTTNASGNYSFSGLANGSYTVTPSLAGYTFSPTSSAANVSGANITGTNFVATANTVPTYSIAGSVSGAVLSGVTITLSGAGSATTITNANGNYSFSGLANGSYTVTPSLTGYTFTSASTSVNVSGANITGTNFVATANTVPTYSISGAVSGAVLSGVKITLSVTGSATATTNASGNYSFSNLVNGSYTVTPSMAGYTFTPASSSATVSGANITGTNFSGSVASAALVDNGNGTVTDIGSGLMWQKATAPGTYTWQQALSYCENLSLAGYSDWRLPNYNELWSLVDNSRHSPAIDPLLAPYTVSDFYWSSTSDTIPPPNPDAAWFVDFDLGGWSYVMYKSNSCYVRAVRGGQSPP